MSNFVPEFHDEVLFKKMPYVSFLDFEVSKIGFGGSHMSGGVEFANDGITPIRGHQRHIDTCVQAIKSGINYIDTAPLYGGGRAEIVLGMALKQIPRNAYYLATKIGRNHECEFAYDKQSVLSTFEESLRRLDVNSVDILQVHDVEFGDLNQIVTETLPALDELKSAGKFKYIGITGYDLEVLKEIVERSKVKIDFVLSYCKNTLFNRTYLDFIPYFKEKKLGLINAGALGMGLLTNNPAPSWHPASDELKKICCQMARECKESGLDLSRLALGYSLKCEQIDLHLVGNQTLDILKSNLNLVCNGLTNEENEMLSKLLDKHFGVKQNEHWNQVEVNRFRANANEFYAFLRFEYRK